MLREQLDEAQKAYDRTKAEYERLEQELEELNSRLDALKEEQQQNALKKQQTGRSDSRSWKNRSWRGNRASEHFKARLAVTQRGSCTPPGRNSEKLTEEKLTLQEKLREIQRNLREEEKQLENIRF